MAITYNGMQYNDDGSPLGHSGPWINPNYAYSGAVLGTAGDGAAGRFDAASLNADGGRTGMSIDPSFQFGTQGAGTGGLAMPSYAVGRPDYQPPAQTYNNLQTMPEPMGGGDYLSSAPGAPAPGGATGYAPPAQLGNSAGGYGGSTNPYLSNMADEIGRRTQQGLGQAFNQIRSNAVGVGGLGGSRQGVAQGIATGNAMDSQQGQLANLFGNQYNQDAGRELTRYQADQGFYTAQRGQDQTGAALGANLYSQGMNGQWDPLKNQNSLIGNYTGFGNTTNSQNSGGGAMGVLGGALGAAQLGSNMGWWGGSKPATSALGNSSITGAGSPYDYTGQSWF